MKFKLDENMGILGVSHLRAGGHDTATVEEQKMCSSPDESVIGPAAKREDASSPSILSSPIPLFTTPRNTPESSCFAFQPNQGKPTSWTVFKLFWRPWGNLIFKENFGWSEKEGSASTSRILWKIKPRLMMRP